MTKVTSKNYDQNVLKEGPQFQIDKFYELKDAQMKKRVNIITDMIKLTQRQTILDLGCGVGTFAFHCARGGLLSIGIDYSSESIKIAKALCGRFGVSAKAKFAVANSASLPFKGGCFDKIIAVDFIEHLRPDEKLSFLSESLRLLKGQGEMIVFTPNGIREKIGEWYWRLRNALFKDNIPHTELHFGLTTKNEFEALLKENGFTFSFRYEDVVRPYLARLPVIKSFLALNLLWVIKKT